MIYPLNNTPFDVYTCTYITTITIERNFVSLITKHEKLNIQPCLFYNIKKEAFYMFTYRLCNNHLSAPCELQ